MSGNGQLPMSDLAPIGGGYYLRKDAAAAYLAMKAEAERDGLTLGVIAGYRTLARQWFFWDLYKSGRGNLAAYPGTSNHGLGLAIDLTPYASRATVDRIGAKYGWSKAHSDAPSEWWHVKWDGSWHGHAADPVIRKGTKNTAAVARLQRLLRGLNLTKQSNAKYNIWTRRAVRRFQEKHHMTVDGVVGAATWAALRKAQG